MPRKGVNISKDPCQTVVHENNSASNRLQLVERLAPTRLWQNVDLETLSERRALAQFSEELQDLDARVQVIRSSHPDFIRKQEHLAEDGTAATTDHAKVPDTSGRTIVARVKKAQGIDAGDDQRHEDEIEIPSGRRFGLKSRGHAMTRMEYFAEHTELVLPQIEHHYMLRDPATGSSLVDVKKLQSAGCGGPKTSADQQQDRVLCLPSVTVAPCAGSGPSVCSVQSLSPSHSAASYYPAQRLDRIAELRQIREDRGRSARESARKQAILRRYALMEAQAQREDKKEIAARHRHLMSRLACAMALQTLRALLSFAHGFMEHYEAARGLTVVDEALQCPSAMRQVLEEFQRSLGGGLADFPTAFVLQRNFHLALQHRLVLKVRDNTRARAWRNWFHALRVIEFVGRLKKKLVLHYYAEAIKRFIDSTWSRYRTRRAVHYYIVAVKVVQRRVRAWQQTWGLLLRSFYVPAVVEAELALTLKTFAGHSLLTVRRSSVAKPPLSAEKEREKAKHERRVSRAHAQKFSLGASKHFRLAKKALRARASRWWKQYQELRAAHRASRERWQLWLREIKAFGSYCPDSCPPPPMLEEEVPVPTPLSEVDREFVFAMVKAALQKGELGKAFEHVG